jgi:two-component system chemotaxis response regulator CheY
MLSKYGDCDSVGNGREAVETFAAARLGGLGYDLVCLDVRMPEIEGPQALQEIRKIEKDNRVPSGLARVFMTTSVGDREIVAGSIKFKCDAYLLKPINLKRLEERLQFFGLIPRERWLAPP